jgi:hypothetical protein
MRSCDSIAAHVAEASHLAESVCATSPLARLIGPPNRKHFERT